MKRDRRTVLGSANTCTSERHWRTKDRAQNPLWPDPAEVEAVCRQLRAARGLIPLAEITELRAELQLVARGEAFLLQGGDCAETFRQSTRTHVMGTARILHEMGQILSSETDRRVLLVGRIAGQYGKPRSTAMDAQGLVTWRGDIINARDATPAARRPNPRRMLSAYERTQTALKMLQGRPETLYTSHEAIVLEYEESLARRLGDQWFGTSAHMYWIGERTRQPSGAHVDLLSNLSNPVGVKLGPSTTPDEVMALCSKLNPSILPGRLVLIPRLGCDRVADLLPALVSRVQDEGHAVIWQCDPMHGNIAALESGHMTRHFDAIVAEFETFVDVLDELGAIVGGVHLELTSENVTECLGGRTSPVSEREVPRHFESAMDPRLNRDQSLDVAHAIAALISDRR